MKRMADIVYQIIQCLFGAIILIISIIVLFNPHVSMYAMKGWHNIHFFILAAFIALLSYLVYLFIKKKKITFHLSIKLASVLLFLLQVYVCYNIYFRTGWDVNVVISNAEIVASGGVNVDNDYFSRYPNNLMLVAIFSLCFKLNDWFGVLDIENGLMAIITLQCFLSVSAGYLLYQLILKSTSKNTYAWIGWWGYVILNGTSSWLTIPYSDSMGLIFPVLILTLYSWVKEKKHVILNIIGIVLLTYIGYRIKPQAAIMGIAIAIIELFSALSCMSKIRLKNMLGIIFLSIIVLLASNYVYQCCVRTMGYELDKEKSFGWTHFFMMGLSSENAGGYYDPDVSFSAGITDSKERSRQNLEVAFDRIQEYGVLGLMNHGIKKARFNFSDGTFSWSGGGSFYYELYPEKNSLAGPVLRNLCWTTGTKYYINYSIKQMAWLMVLFCMLGNILPLIRRQKVEQVHIVALLSVVGIVLFEMLFEARARYLFLFVPIFILSAVKGLEQIAIYYKDKFKVKNKANNIICE